MKKKLSKIESSETITKRYLEEIFDRKLKPYVTKDFVEEIFDRKLKPYATNDFVVGIFDEKLKPYATKDFVEEVFDRKLKPYATKDFVMEGFEANREAFSEEMTRHINALIENSQHQTQVIIEAFQGKYDNLERRVDTLELKAGI